MCYLGFTAMKFVAMSIFMALFLLYFLCILLRNCFSLQEKQFSAITPPKTYITIFVNLGFFFGILRQLQI